MLNAYNQAEAGQKQAFVVKLQSSRSRPLPTKQYFLYPRKAESMAILPHAKIELTFLSRNEGGRLVVPQAEFLKSLKYRPHIVIGDPQEREMREAVLENIQVIHEGDGQYLGVAFSDVDRDPVENEKLQCEVAYMYFPNVTYRQAVKGARFTLREGARSVGFGEILDVFDKEAVKNA
jgi:hypothetical protein